MTFVPTDGQTDPRTDQPTEAPIGESAGADRRILLIAADNSFCHVYRDLAELLDEPTYGDEFGGGAEFFDITGRRLTTVFTRDWHLVGLQPTAQLAEPETVRQRLKAVVAHLVQFIEQHPDSLGDSRVSVDEALADLPELDHPDLGEVIGALPVHVRGNSGNLLHNAMHAAGWTH
ncbi:hypothetical protein [Micromonospora sp. NPDC092111]|uniref:hypothetical protein n=1 Tax=Micromonospora sp. NPDC092111 TaxID=3364289 RepID=UPI00380DA18F